jgi:formamidopyrimidine-DNA glycosylase
MPEGPECRLTVDFLNESMRGKIVYKWIFCGGKYTDNYPEGYNSFDKFLPAKIDNVSCKGKFIYFTLSKSGEKYYIFHSLMLTGRWQNEHDDYCKCFVEVDNGKTLWFRYTRGFATFYFTSKEEELEKKLSTLGPDIMTPEFKLDMFKSLSKKYANRNITSFLMDQDVIAGCGNYIKAEVLYYSKISPCRKIGDLNDQEIELLFEGLRIIPRLSYNNQSLIYNNYADDEDNKVGDTKKFKIYGNKKAKKTKTADGRTTYWDPNHQV